MNSTLILLLNKYDTYIKKINLKIKNVDEFDIFNNISSYDIDENNNDSIYSININNIYYNNILNQIKKKNNIDTREKYLCEIKLNKHLNDFINTNKQIIKGYNIDWYKFKSKNKYNTICLNNLNNVIKNIDMNNCINFIMNNLNNNGNLLILLDRPFNITLKYIIYLINNGNFEFDNIYTVYNPYINTSINKITYPICLLLKKYNLKKELKYINDDNLDNLDNLTNVSINMLINKYNNIYSNLNNKLDIYYNSLCDNSNDIYSLILYNDLLLLSYMGYNINEAIINTYKINNIKHIIDKHNIKHNNILVLNCNFDIIKKLDILKTNKNDFYINFNENIETTETYLLQQINNNLDKKYNIIIMYNIINIYNIILSWKLLNLNGIIIFNTNIKTDYNIKKIINVFLKIYQNDIKILCNNILIIIQKINIY